MPDSRKMENQMVKDALAPGRACASLATLAALRNASLSRTEEISLRKHLAGCTRCEVELRLLSEFEEATPRPEEEGALRSIVTRLEDRVSGGSAPPRAIPRSGFVASLSRSMFRRVQMGGFAVAAALLVAALGITFREAPPPELGSPPVAPVVFRSGDLGVFSPAGDLREPPSDLRWQPWPAATSYSVRVMEVDHTELWSAETLETTIALPKEVQARIVPRKPLVWEVVARDAAGGVLASSGAHRFQVRKQP